jgi:hypothetical protein
MADQAAELIQQLQNQVLALEQAATAADAAAAAAGAPPAGGAAPPVPPAFTLAPALANTAAAFLDLTSSAGTKHFKGAVESLTATPFDFKDPSDLQVFLDLVLKKSQVYGWNNMLTIPVTNPVTQAVTTNNLLDEYGVIPLESVTTHVTTYYDTHTKQAQDSFMSCQCLLASLAIDFLKIITAESPQYHLPAIVAADGPIPCGPLLLKVIISKAHVDSRATVRVIRTALTNLDDMMMELDSNVQAFNMYVHAQVKSLSARGETSNDLLNNLFKGYKVAADSEFQEFIKRKENEYEEGKDVGVNNLMADAVSKFEARVLTKEWAAPTKEQSQILALTAQVDQLSKAKSKSKQSASSVAVTPGKEKTTPKRGKNPEWAWKDVMPKDGEPKTKDFKGKHYHVACKFHPDRWVCHTSEQCSKNPSNAGSASSSTPDTDQGVKKASARRLKAAKLAAALLEEGDEGEESDDDSVTS